MPNPYQSPSTTPEVRTVRETGLMPWSVLVAIGLNLLFTGLIGFGLSRSPLGFSDLEPDFVLAMLGVAVCGTSAIVGWFRMPVGWLLVAAPYAMASGILLDRALQLLFQVPQGRLLNDPEAALLTVLFLVGAIAFLMVLHLRDARVYYGVQGVTAGVCISVLLVVAGACGVYSWLFVGP